MATESVASFTIVLIRGGVYQKTFTITDEDGVAITLTSAQIDVTPNGSTSFSWTQGNGKFTNSAPGVYDLALTDTDTTSYTWSSGSYAMSIVDDDGDPNPCLISGLIFVKDC